MRIKKDCDACGAEFFPFNDDTGLCPTCREIVDDNGRSALKIKCDDMRDYINYQLIEPRFWYGVGFGILFTCASLVAILFYQVDKCRLVHETSKCVVKIAPR